MAKYPMSIILRSKYYWIDCKFITPYGICGISFCLFVVCLDLVRMVAFRLIIVIKCKLNMFISKVHTNIFPTNKIVGNSLLLGIRLAVCYYFALVKKCQLSIKKKQSVLDVQAEWPLGNRINIQAKISLTECNLFEICLN